MQSLRCTTGITTRHRVLVAVPNSLDGGALVTVRGFRVRSLALVIKLSYGGVVSLLLLAGLDGKSSLQFTKQDKLFEKLRVRRIKTNQKTTSHKPYNEAPVSRYPMSTSSRMPKTTLYL